MTLQPESPLRVRSIDVVRGFTLFLMLFVNDVFMRGVPAWIGHTEAHTDGMGLADWVFPSFLFMVGMSIPYALAARRRKGAKSGAIAGHILFRTASLILIGVALLNAGRLDPALTHVGRWAWTLSFYAALFLFWNVHASRVARWVGAVWLVLLLALFRSSSPEAPWLVASWWGILGLIGWGYLVAAAVSLLSGGRLGWAVGAWAFFLGLNLLSSAECMEWTAPLQPWLGPILQGNVPMIVTAGMAVGTFLFRSQLAPKRKALWIAAAGALSVAAGFGLRPWFILSKILATPSWGLLCNGWTMLLFALVYFRMDVRGHLRGTEFFAMAGRNSMTTYLVPSAVYTLVWALGWNLFFYKQPDSAWLNILGSLTWAWGMIWLSEGLSRIGIRLKL